MAPAGRGQRLTAAKDVGKEAAATKKDAAGRYANLVYIDLLPHSDNQSSIQPLIASYPIEGGSEEKSEREEKEEWKSEEDDDKTHHPQPLPNINNELTPRITRYVHGGRVIKKPPKQKERRTCDFKGCEITAPIETRLSRKGKLGALCAVQGL
jgi:hypothetical protein